MTITKIRRAGNYLKAITPGQSDITVSMGNGKLSHDIMIWNLPAITTCPVNKDCKDTCYARKAEHRYPAVVACRARNYKATLPPDTFADRMVTLITHSIEKRGIKAVRVHESGDFYNQAYADAWEEIAFRVHLVHPWVKLFAYTKSPYRPATGFNIVESILPDGSINYGPHAEIIAKAKQFRAKVCPYGLAKTTLTCGVECTACQNHKYVVFLQH